MFHHFFDSIGHPRGQGAVAADEFDRMIKAIGVERILPAQEWMDRVTRGVRKSDEICLTFDDGLRCQYDVALPVLEQYGLTAFWFVYSSAVAEARGPMEIYRHYRTTRFKTVEQFYERFENAIAHSPHRSTVQEALRGFDPASYLAPYPYYTPEDRRFRYIRDAILGDVLYHEIMDAMLAEDRIDPRSLAPDLWLGPNEIRKLDRNGHVIGLHSYSHPMTLAEAPRQVQYEEYSLNSDHLKSIIGYAPTAAAYPCGSYNRDTIEIMIEVGVRIGFIDSLSVRGDSVYELPRLDQALLNTI